MNIAKEFILIYVTTPSIEEAKLVADSIVRNKLAACANILPGMQSVYWWEDKLCSEEEVVVVFKTPKENFASIESKIKEKHSYDCPCVVALPITQGSPEYLKWLANETQL